MDTIVKKELKDTLAIHAEAVQNQGKLTFSSNKSHLNIEGDPFHQESWETCHSILKEIRRHLKSGKCIDIHIDLTALPVMGEVFMNHLGRAIEKFAKNEQINQIDWPFTDKYSELRTNGLRLLAPEND